MQLIETSQISHSFRPRIRKVKPGRVINLPEWHPHEPEKDSWEIQEDRFPFLYAQSFTGINHIIYTDRRRTLAGGDPVGLDGVQRGDASTQAAQPLGLPES